MEPASCHSAIVAAYAEATRNTLRVWADEAHAGAPVTYPDDTTKLCISSGRKFAATGALAVLHAHLLALAQSDPTLDVVPVASLHFSFLAMSWGLYSQPSEAPASVADLARLLMAHASAVPFAISQLRLVPLRNSMVLAGLPDEATFAARRAFAQAVLAGASDWREQTRARYKGYDIPPVFWHTTLARANTQFAPQPLRNAYFAFHDAHFYDLHLGAPQLALVNYNWSRCFVISS